jgi:hypothetical protein
MFTQLLPDIREMCTELREYSELLVMMTRRDLKVRSARGEDVLRHGRLAKRGGRESAGGRPAVGSARRASGRMAAVASAIVA